MKTGIVALAVSAFALISAPAGAADMPVKAPPGPVAPPAPIYAWTGCYIGGNLGAARDHIWDQRIAFGGGTPDVLPTENDKSSDHLVGGGQIGCDYQINQWVFGLQVQNDWGHINSSHPGILFPTFFYNTSVQGFVTYTGRIGYTILPQALLYAKGGGAWTRDHIYVTVPTLNFLSEAANTVYFTGWTLGGGLEWLLLPYLSVFVEYDHIDFGKRTVEFISGPQAVGAGLPSDIINHAQQVNTVLAGINLRCCAGRF